MEGIEVGAVVRVASQDEVGTVSRSARDDGITLYWVEPLRLWGRTKRRGPASEIGPFRAHELYVGIRGDDPDRRA